MRLKYGKEYHCIDKVTGYKDDKTDPIKEHASWHGSLHFFPQIRRHLSEKKKRKQFKATLAGCQ